MCHANNEKEWNYQIKKKLNPRGKGNLQIMGILEADTIKQVEMTYNLTYICTQKYFLAEQLTQQLAAQPN